MADTISTSYELKMVAEFADNDYRTLTLANPLANITENTITNFAKKCVGVLVGDQTGAKFSRFKSAKKVTTMTRKLDLVAND